VWFNLLPARVRLWSAPTCRRFESGDMSPQSIKLERLRRDGAEAQWLFLPEPSTRNPVLIRNPGYHEPAFLLPSWIPHPGEIQTMKESWQQRQIPRV